MWHKTGYVFPDAASISPYLEEPRVGPTSQFCAALAARLCCYVVAGYPERLKSEEVHRAVLEPDENGIVKEVDKVGANSAALYGPNGEFVGDYRKTNLYETDMTWARAGTYTFAPLVYSFAPSDAICLSTRVT